MIGRRALLRATGLAPLAPRKRRRRVGWESNNIFQVLIISGGPGSGAFAYSLSPAFGNLVATITATSGTDIFGNAYLAGVTSYGGGGTLAANSSGGGYNMYTAAGPGGPWLLQGVIQITSGGVLQLQGNTRVESLSPMQVDGATLITAGLAVGLVLQVVNTTAGATGALTQMTVAATGDSWLGCRVSGDTQNRIRLTTNAGGQAQVGFGSGSAAPDVFLNRIAAGVLGLVSTDLAIDTAGRGLQVKEGTNAKQGTGTLVAGTVTVANTSVTATSRIFLTAQDNSTTGALRVSARTAGTSFVITSSNAADTGVVAYELFEPAP